MNDVTLKIDIPELNEIMLTFQNQANQLTNMIKHVDRCIHELETLYFKFNNAIEESKKLRKMKT